MAYRIAEYGTVWVITHISPCTYTKFSKESRWIPFIPITLALVCCVYFFLFLLVTPSLLKSIHGPHTIEQWRFLLHSQPLVTSNQKINVLAWLCPWVRLLPWVVGWQPSSVSYCHWASERMFFFLVADSHRWTLD